MLATCLHRAINVHTTDQPTPRPSCRFVLLHKKPWVLDWRSDSGRCTTWGLQIIVCPRTKALVVVLVLVSLACCYCPAGPQGCWRTKRCDQEAQHNTTHTTQHIQTHTHNHTTHMHIHNKNETHTENNTQCDTTKPKQRTPQHNTTDNKNHLLSHSTLAIKWVNCLIPHHTSRHAVALYSILPYSIWFFRTLLDFAVLNVIFSYSIPFGINNTIFSYSTRFCCTQCDFFVLCLILPYSVWFFRTLLDFAVLNAIFSYSTRFGVLNLIFLYSTWFCCT